MVLPYRVCKTNLLSELLDLLAEYLQFHEELSERIHSCYLYVLKSEHDYYLVRNDRFQRVLQLSLGHPKKGLSEQDGFLFPQDTQVQLYSGLSGMTFMRRGPNKLERKGSFFEE